MPDQQRVVFAAPLDIAGSLELFKRSGDDLVDRWDGSTLVRALRVGDEHVAFAATLEGGVEAPAMRVSTSSAQHASLVLETVANSFVPAALDYPELLARDPVLRRLDAQFPGIRQIRQLDLFTALMRCISAQQVNLRWALTTRRRLTEAFGTCHEVDGHRVFSLNPEQIADVKPEQIRALQFTTSKSVSIVATARALLDQDLSVETLQPLPDEEIIARLTAIRGIGRWSAEWVLARTLGRPTVVAGDLGVRKAIALAYLDGRLPSELEVRHLTRHWSASASTAQALLLHALGEGALQPTAPTVLKTPGVVE